MSGRLAKSGVLDVVATAVPGIDDILVLGKVKQLERARKGTTSSCSTRRRPATRSPSCARPRAARCREGGADRTQANDVLELLTDPERCQVVLVTLPEETPVNELVETAFALEDRVGVAARAGGGERPLPGGLAPTPTGRPPAEARRCARRRGRDPGGGGQFRARRPQQRRAGGRLAGRLAAAQIHLPFLFTAACPVDDLESSPTPRRRRRWRLSRRHSTPADSLGWSPSGSVIVCCGSGGVGKTTAAVLADRGARAGRRAVVVTIDPAKRLADALGLDGLTNEPARPTRRRRPDARGGRRAVGGDARHEVARSTTSSRSTPPTPSRRSASSSNRFYRNISGALSGTQEYMAMEKLYELHEDAASTSSWSTRHRPATRSTSSTRPAA